jgi:hypothetical protein
MTRQFTIPEPITLPAISTDSPPHPYPFETFITEWMLGQCLAEGLSLAECEAAMAVEKAIRNKKAGETISLTEDVWAAALRVVKPALDKKLGIVQPQYIPSLLQMYHTFASATQRLEQ